MGEEGYSGETSHGVPLQRINEYMWRIPESYKPGMTVPGLILADEKLLEKMRSDRTLVQCANVATLPGIYKYSITLPDGHEGYGFPIGGVGAFDAETGVVSPGGVGYDINCLPPDAKVLMEYGCWTPIKDLLKGSPVICLNGKKVRNTRVVLNFCRNDRHLYTIVTKTGMRLKATSDHPVLTPYGMVNISELKPGVKVATYPFSGIKYEKPEHFIILNWDEFDVNIAKELKARGLLPLHSDNPKLPILIKLLGYFIGDGSFDGKKTYFYGSLEGLKEISEDLEKLGYKPSRVFTRRKSSKLNDRGFTGVENSIFVSARSFRALLEKLGAPAGKKVSAQFTVPMWLKRLPKWLKRLFLAAYFGAEMNKPQTVNGYNFEQPFVSLTKDKEAVNSGIQFFKEIAELTEEFDVKSLGVRIEDLKSKVRLKLVFSEKPESLLNLWSKIGYVYCPERQRLALRAVSWIRLKLKVVEERREVAETVVALHGSGSSTSAIVSQIQSTRVDRRFIERSMYESRETSPRVPWNLPTFEEWATENAVSDIVWDEVERVYVEPYEGPVYDIMVEDEAHNFVAEGFIVSNCGVRLVKTNLTVKDIKPVLKQLTVTLFRNVPSGLGSRRRDFRVTSRDLDALMVEGAEWVVKRGLGWDEDLEYCEERGSISGADPSRVSNTARSRGEPQIGTLGSGNHFLEIDVVDRIEDPEVAKVFGIEYEGQIMVLIHTGSRGFGHQICSDYLKVMERAMHRYGIRTPDRELACVPASSREGEDYVKAMKCGVNYAFANRQAIMHWVRESFSSIFKVSPEDLDMHLIYDVAHNIAKLEEHVVDNKGSERKVYVHRKGATRAFPANRPEIPVKYRNVGQPVLLPGSMADSSWVLVGTPKSMELTFGSTAHGAGRLLSRAKAKERWRGEAIKREMERQGIMVEAASLSVLSEEASGAYKPCDLVAEVSHRVGIATKVARLVPIAVVKG